MITQRRIGESTWVIHARLGIFELRATAGNKLMLCAKYACRLHALLVAHALSSGRRAL
jgi:hypothetical protein